MDDGIFSPAPIHGGSFASDMDLDYMNELLGDGCWLETIQGSDFMQQSPSNSTNFLNSPCVWSSSDAYCGDYNFGQPQEGQPEVCPKPSLLSGASMDESQSENVAKSQTTDQKELGRLAGCSGQTNSFRVDETEFGKRWWIGPGATAGPKMSVMERLVQAIGCIKDSSKDRDVLIQIWVPIDLNGMRVLTTTGQPYVLDSNNTSLSSYRHISQNFQFSAEKNSNLTEGMPGRVFLGKVPEWTPDVRFFRSDEYARVDYAQRFNVRGTLALPVFDQGSRTCLGVIEVVTTTQNIKPELDSVCKALKAVDLTSAERESSQKVKTSTSIQSYHAALPEILEVLKSACLTHKLPLAQTWMPCSQQGKEGCRHSVENYAQCVSTVDAACYIADPKFHGFHETCSEHHLLRGQGVAGKAFTTNEPCFYDDITSFGKTEYPLSHHARMFGLHAAVAIRLRSVHTGAADFVLEFFLPSGCREPEEQKKMLGLLSIIIQKTCKSLRVVTDEELANDTMTSVTASEVLQRHDGKEAPKITHTCSDVYSHELSIKASSVTDAQQNHNIAPFIQKEEPSELLYENSTVLQSDHVGASFVDYGTLGESHSANMGGAAERKRSKAEKAITLEVLQRHFSGSLKDAAKNLGVCPTTLKRICRGQGIKRWPSRKIKKVGNSLEKLQRVIDSVQGPSGSFQIGSFYSNFPELASPSSKSGVTNQFSASKPSTAPLTLSMQPKGNAASPPTKSKSPSSSCSQSSSSSHSYSSSSPHKPSTINSAGSQDANIGKRNTEDVMPKGTRSDAQLNQVSQEDLNKMPRSLSHLTLSETTHVECPPPLPYSKRKELDGTRVKVTYGDDKVRIRMQNHWLLTDLRKEIARRFNIDDQIEMQLKYLDDDSEWVLITCDADWEECVDVCLSSLGNTLKLSLHAPPHHLGSSLVSRNPS